MQNFKDQSGFVALTSAIIIVLVLVTITVIASLSGFLGRFNILDGELKEVSTGLAEACVEIAILKLSQNPLYAGNENDIPLEDGACDILTIAPSGGNKVVKTRAIFNNSYTNLEVEVDGITFKPVSWRECPNPC